MGSRTITKPTMPAPSRRRRLLHSGPAIGALLVIGGIYTILSGPLSIGPRWLILGVIVALLCVLIGALYLGHHSLTRTISFALLGVITLAETVSAFALIVDLLTSTSRLSDVPHTTALVLLQDGALVWLVNILTFAVWYWEVDGGGPSRRLHGYQRDDLLFPQLTLGDQRWMPHFVDYLFLAFNTSTAFSPTDTLALSVRVKLLMMLQSLISLTVIAIIAARAINTL